MVRVEAVAEAADDATDDVAECVERLAALAHLFDGEEGAAVGHDKLAVAGGGRGTDFLINVEPVANDGRVADAAGHFEAEAAGGASAGELAACVASENADGVVRGIGRGERARGRSITLFNVHGRGFAGVGGELSVGFGGSPGDVCRAGGGREEIGRMGRESEAIGEGFGAFAREHDVHGLIHDSAGEARGAGAASDKANRTDPAGFGVGHDTGVEADATGGVGEAADADGINRWVILNGGGASDDSVEGGAAGGEDGPGGGVGNMAEGPGGEDEGRVNSGGQGGHGARVGFACRAPRRSSVRVLSPSESMSVVRSGVCWGAASRQSTAHPLPPPPVRGF